MTSSPQICPTVFQQEWKSLGHVYPGLKKIEAACKRMRNFRMDVYPVFHEFEKLGNRPYIFISCSTGISNRLQAAFVSCYLQARKDKFELSMQWDQSYPHALWYAVPDPKSYPIPSLFCAKIKR